MAHDTSGHFSASESLTSPQSLIGLSHNLYPFCSDSVADD